MDRRIEKTKKAIMDALTALMAEKDFDKITINEIADLANVNRGTVYLHYVDKFDLLNQCIETHLKRLFENCIKTDESLQDSPKAAMLRIFEYLEKNIVFYRILLTSKGTPTFRDQLLNMVRIMIEYQLAREGIDQKMNKEILVQYVSSAIVGIMEWWIVRSMPYPSAEMVAQLWMLFEKVQLVRHP